MLQVRGGENMDFKSAYKKADDLLKKWGEKGITIAGETAEDWLFKGNDVSGDMLSGSTILIDKNSGEMRLFNAGSRRDRDAGRTAKQIDIESILSNGFIEEDHSGDR